jgi:hypothetical protein
MDPTTWAEFVDWVNQESRLGYENIEVFRYLSDFCRYIFKAVKLDEQSGNWIIQNQFRMGNAVELALYLLEKLT